MRRAKFPQGFVSPTVQIFRAFEAIFNNFRYYTGMSCYLVPKDDSGQWLCLQPSPNNYGINEYEDRFGPPQDRARYNQANFKRAAKEKRTICSRHSGFYDFCVPVLCGGKCIAFVASGYFHKALPTWGELERQWAIWTGQKPLPDETDFKRFVINALNMPLLDGPQTNAHRKLLEMVAALISGEGNPEEIAARATELNHRVFTKWKLNVGWPRKALGLEFPASDRSWTDKHFGENDQIVTKIKRPPTVALALLLVDEADHCLDQVDAMIRQKRLEREGFFYAQRLDETVAFSWWDEGLVFLTSPRPGSNATQARLQIREKARTIADRMGKLFGTRALIGIGSILPPGEGLNPSCQEAFQALQWAIHQNKGLIFYDEIEAMETLPRGKAKPWPDAPKLVETCLRGSKAEKAFVLDHYLGDVLRQTAERADLVRVHLVDALTLYATSLEKTLLLPSGRLSIYLQEWIPRLEKPQATHELIGMFKTAIQVFSEFASNPPAAERETTAKELKAYVAEHFRSPLRANHAAKQMGLTKPTFYRWVKKWIGMGFNEYVQKVRLEEAKRLLRTGRYSVARVAQDCGFTSSGYFIWAFKKSTRQTPQQYRNHPES
jgi:AraC-like DNA-binding protein